MNAVIKDDPARVAAPEIQEMDNREYFDDMPEQVRRRLIAIHLLKCEDLRGVLGDILLDLNNTRVLINFETGDECATGKHIHDLIYNAVSRQIKKERGEL